MKESAKRPFFEKRLKPLLESVFAPSLSSLAFPLMAFATSNTDIPTFTEKF